jgi:hypothetical protein
MRVDQEPNLDGRPLRDTVLDEQSRDWDQGRRLPAEDYLERYPTLAEDAEAALDVVYHEYVLRARHGETPEPEDIVRRFPQWSEALIRQFAVDEAMRLTGVGEEAVAERHAKPKTLWPTPTLEANTESGIAPAGYEILGELGRGGMGIVYKARDVLLGRVVALKTLAAWQQATPDQIDRFKVEAQAVARIRHPSIIQVYAVGEFEGRPYVSLEFAEGGSLDAVMTQGPMAAGKAAELVEVIAGAIHAAHLAGVIHRDLKPSNVLMTAEQVPKVGDFGLAKLLDGDPARTTTGQVLGTPSYMAPEQAEGKSKQVGPAADVYALGAILYRALTGRPPFLGESPMETVRLALSTEVVTPSRLRDKIPRDLETVCLKCLEKEPGKRYASADALADDLRRFREGRQITARPVGPAGRAWRWCRRNRAVAGLSALVFLSLVAGLAASLTFALRERHQAEALRIARARDIETLNAIVLNEEHMPSAETWSYRKRLVDEGLRQLEEILRESEGDPKAVFLLAKGYLVRAKLMAEKGDREGANRGAQGAAEFFERTTVVDHSSPWFRGELADLLHEYSALVPDHEAKRSAARRSNELYEGLLREDPVAAKAYSVSNIALNLHNIGGTYFEDSQASEGAVAEELSRKAIETFRQGKRWCQKQIQGSQDDALLSGLAMTERYLCRAHRTHAGRFPGLIAWLGHDKAAIEEGRSALSRYQELVARNPESFDLAMQFVLAQHELGMVHFDRARWDDAIKAFEAECQLLKAQAKAPGVPVSRKVAIFEQWVVAAHNLQNALDASDPVRNDEAKKTLTVEIHDICEKLELVVNPLSPSLSQPYASSCFSLADAQEEDGREVDLNLLLKAEEQYGAVLQANPAVNEPRGWLVIVRQKLGDELEARGRVGEALDCRRRSLDPVRGNPGLIYEIASVYSLNAQFTGRFRTNLSAARLKARRERFTRLALLMLHEAADAGFKDATRLRKDKTFDPVRSTPEFKTIESDVGFPADPFGNNK